MDGAKEGGGVTDSWSKSTAQGRIAPPAIDTSVAHPARVYDYWLGGKDNYPADRAAGAAAAEANPNILIGVRANRSFLHRAVRYLAADAGIRQFLDIGTGLPSANNTHEVAQAVAPQARIVYVDNDPIVLAHARALLTSTPDGATAYVDADVRDPEKILQAAAETLDFSKPVAVMTLMIMQYIPDSDDPHAIVARLLGAVPSGSYLVASDTARDIDAETVATATGRLNQRMAAAQLTPRLKAEIVAFFDGLEMVDPGLVPLNRWRPGPDDPVLEHDLPTYCGIGRKP
jgi:hypothetical protein